MLWSYSLVKEFHVFEVGEDERIGGSVVWVGVSLLHASKLVLIVRLSISLLVLWLSPTVNKMTLQI